MEQAGCQWSMLGCIEWSKVDLGFTRSKNRLARMGEKGNGMAAVDSRLARGAERGCCACAGGQPKNRLIVSDGEIRRSLLLEKQSSSFPTESP